MNYKEPFPQLRENSIQRKIPIIHTETVFYFANLIKKYKPKSILEIGTAIGYSSLVMAKYSTDDFLIDTIDSSEPAVMEARKHIEKYNYSNHIKVYYDEGINFLQNVNKKYDFIFIDAMKKEYLEYYRLAKLKLKDNGIIVLDNLLWKGKVRQNRNFKDNRVEILRTFNHKFLNDNSGETNIYEIGDGIGVYFPF
ncbi:MAG: class I SAM-dependent methyltransferase [Candidatus Marinimicrobia bacterium]|nr:class I SAM-dependent methyltransferase [Candidatus Neomarinimicrobiota bacterium]